MSNKSLEIMNQSFDFEKENKYLKLTIQALRDKLEQIVDDVEEILEAEYADEDIILE